jgi:hypothetical protein
MSQSIEVVVRVRPSLKQSNAITRLNEEEDNFSVGNTPGVLFEETNGKIYLNRMKSKGQSEYTFDKVFGPSADQEDVFQACDVIDQVIDGINCCVMTYGQTSTGKTYTMYGKGWEETGNFNVRHFQQPPSINNNSNSNAAGDNMTSNNNILSRSGPLNLSGPLTTRSTQDNNDNESVNDSVHESDNDKEDDDSGLNIGNSKVSIGSGGVGSGHGSGSVSGIGIGIVPRCVNSLFQRLEHLQSQSTAVKDSSFSYSISKLITML